MELKYRKNNCSIVRGERYINDVSVAGKAVVQNENGNIVFIVEDRFTNLEIWDILSIANEFFIDGYECGQKHKSFEILQAFGAEAFIDMFKENEF